MLRPFSRHGATAAAAATMSVAALFASLNPDEQRFMLAPPGTLPPLSSAALAAAAVWTVRETGSVATLEALCPGGAYMVSPGELPGEACNVDMSHLVCIGGGEKCVGGVRWGGCDGRRKFGRRQLAAGVIAGRRWLRARHGRERGGCVLAASH